MHLRAVTARSPPVELETDVASSALFCRFGFVRANCAGRPPARLAAGVSLGAARPWVDRTPTMRLIVLRPMPLRGHFSLIRSARTRWRRHEAGTAGCPLKTLGNLA